MTNISCLQPCNPHAELHTFAGDLAVPSREEWRCPGISISAKAAVMPHGSDVALCVQGEGCLPSFSYFTNLACMRTCMCMCVLWPGCTNSNTLTHEQKHFIPSLFTGWFARYWCISLPAAKGCDDFLTATKFTMWQPPPWLMLEMAIPDPRAESSHISYERTMLSICK